MVPLRKALTRKTGEIFPPGPIIRATWDGQAESLQLVRPETVDSLLFMSFKTSLCRLTAEVGFF